MSHLSIKHNIEPSWIVQKIWLPVWLLILSLGFSHIGAANELSGKISVEGRFFPESTIYADQRSNNISAVVQPEYYHEWQNGNSFIFVPFARFDSSDSERSHFDIRELNYLWLSDNFELRSGIGKVFWGVTEFVHLVDIINQTDQLESIDGEEKLGQPMVQFSMARDWGTIDLFLLPLFRERTYPGKNSRLRSEFIVDPDNSRFESSAEERHVDLAVHYNQTFGDLDFGIYHFWGTGREPTLLLSSNEKGETIFVPFYEQINQTGVYLQLVVGEWLWKLESISRSGQSEDFFAVAGGFEYTFVGLADSQIDLGIITELAYDDRGDASSTSFENDLMIGLRLTVNDAASSELLVGVKQDLDNTSKVSSFEASRRFSDNIKGTLQAGFFFDVEEEDLFYSIRDDDFIQLELSYYF